MGKSRYSKKDFDQMSLAEISHLLFENYHEELAYGYPLPEAIKLSLIERCEGDPADWKSRLQREIENPSAKMIGNLVQIEKMQTA